jgi:hypothetical protein
MPYFSGGLRPQTGASRLLNKSLPKLSAVVIILCASSPNFLHESAVWRQMIGRRDCSVGEPAAGARACVFMTVSIDCDARQAEPEPL